MIRAQEAAIFGRGSAPRSAGGQGRHYPHATTTSSKGVNCAGGSRQWEKRRSSQRLLGVERVTNRMQRLPNQGMMCAPSTGEAALLVALGVEGVARSQQGRARGRRAPRQRRHQSLHMPTVRHSDIDLIQTMTSISSDPPCGQVVPLMKGGPFLGQSKSTEQPPFPNDDFLLPVTSMCSNSPTDEEGGSCLGQ